MKKEKENRIEMDRRGFLKAAAISSMAFCMSPSLEKVQAAGSAAGIQTSAANRSVPPSMAAVRCQRTLGSGKAAFTVSAIGWLYGAES